MLRSNRQSAVAAACTLLARAVHANRCSHEVRSRDWRAVVVADSRFDRIIGCTHCINCICIRC
eukprot:6752444-Lingulodinium_polyedra.AAC.1